MSSSSTQKPQKIDIDSVRTEGAEPLSAIPNSAATKVPRRQNKQTNRPASSPYARRVAREAEIRRLEHELWKAEMKANRIRVEKWLEDIYVGGAPPFGGGEGGLGERVERGVLEAKIQSEEGLGEKTLSDKMLSEKDPAEEEITGKELSEKQLIEKDLSEKNFSEEELGEEDLSEETLSGKQLRISGGGKMFRRSWMRRGRDI